MTARTDKTIPEPGRVRLTLDLTKKLNTEVERLAQESGTSKADVLRFAVELLSAASDAKEAGMRVGAWKERDDGVRSERIFVGI